MKPNSDTTPALYIGLDAHKEKTSVAIADPGANGEVRSHGEVATTQVALERLIRRIAKARKVPVSRFSPCYGAWDSTIQVRPHGMTPTSATCVNSPYHSPPTV